MSKWGSFGTKKNDNEKTGDQTSSKVLVAGGGMFSSAADTYNQEKVILQSRDALDEAQRGVTEILNMFDRLPNEPEFKNDDGSTTSVKSAVLEAMGPKVAKKMNFGIDAPTASHSAPGLGSSPMSGGDEQE